MLGRAATTRPTLISSTSMPADGRTISGCWSGIGSPTSMAEPILMGPWHGWCLHCEWFTLELSSSARNMEDEGISPSFCARRLMPHVVPARTATQVARLNPLLETPAGRSRLLNPAEHAATPFSPPFLFLQACPICFLHSA